ncbi:MAG TPA: aromatic amino acid ammonia-lyase [Candidatus Dormibacteraeota bacterium]|nr:aromatic amino acid ammonia-lyase [Candidatus Dormibacteraeota bacterium]
MTPRHPKLSMVTLGTRAITADEVHELAVHGARLEVSRMRRERVRRASAVVERALSRGRMIYGLNTYVGHLRDRPIRPEDMLDYQHQLLAMHARGIGDPLPVHDVRALMLVRIVGMSHGGSGAHPDVFDKLIDLLNAGVHPVVPAGGSVGESDLTQMAAVGLVLTGRGDAVYQGNVLPAAEALARAGMKPVQLRPKDGLALISANGMSIGMGALAVVDMDRLSRLADSIGCLSLEAIGGSLEPFGAEVTAAKPFPGQLAAAKHMRQSLAGSYLESRRDGSSVQDPLSFRVMPQVHGALREYISFAREAVEIELNSSGDNPMVSLRADDLISNGNFDPLVLGLSFESLRLALAHVAMLSERRINRLRFHGIPAGRMAAWRLRFPFRPYQGPSVHSASGLLAEIKHLANPVTLASTLVNPDAEDHSTLAPQAVTLTRTVLHRLQTLLTIEAVMACDVLGDEPDLPMLGVGSLEVCDVVGDVTSAMGEDVSAAVYCEALRKRLFED